MSVQLNMKRAVIFAFASAAMFAVAIVIPLVAYARAQSPASQIGFEKQAIEQMNARYAQIIPAGVTSIDKVPVPTFVISNRFGANWVIARGLEASATVIYYPTNIKIISITTEREPDRNGRIDITSGVICSLALTRTDHVRENGQDVPVVRSKVLKFTSYSDLEPEFIAVNPGTLKYLLDTVAEGKKR